MGKCEMNKFLLLHYRGLSKTKVKMQTVQENNDQKAISIKNIT